MCFTEDGLMAWIKNRTHKSSEKPEIRQHSTSPRSRVTVATPNTRGKKMETACLRGVPRQEMLRTTQSMDSMALDNTSPTTPKSTYRGSKSPPGDSGIGMSSPPPSPVEGSHTYHTAVPAFRIPNPRLTITSRSSSGPASTAQWSLFPKEDAHSTLNYSRPVTAGSQRPLTSTASTRAEPKFSLKNISPTAVQVKTSPSYPRSEIASIHRNTHRFSYQSEAFDVPPSPPPKPDFTPLPTIQPSRPVSFRTFITQSKGRSQPQTHSNSSASTLNVPTPVSTRPSMRNHTPRSAGPPPVTKHRSSRRTSLKSYLGRNGYSDEGIFVATSDDPNVPFTMFRWPNPSHRDSGSGISTPRSSALSDG